MTAVVIMTDYLPITYEDEGYCSFAYSALACFRMGMSESELISLRTVHQNALTLFGRRLQLAELRGSAEFHE